MDVKNLAAATQLWCVGGFNSLDMAALCQLASLSLRMWSRCAWGNLCSERYPAQGQPCFPMLNHVTVNKQGDSLVMLSLYLLRWQHQWSWRIAGFQLLHMPARRKLSCICLRFWIVCWVFFLRVLKDKQLDMSTYCIRETGTGMGCVV